MTGGVRRLGSGGPWEDAVGYSRVVVAGGMAWTAGCTAVVGGEVVAEGDAYEQTLVALGIALEALDRVGFAPATVVQSRMYVVDVQTNGAAVGRAHRAVLGDVRPAATMVGVAELLDARMIVEVELVAHREGAA